MKTLSFSSAAHIWRAAPRECSAAATCADSRRFAERFTAFCCLTADAGKLAAALPRLEREMADHEARRQNLEDQLKGAEQKLMIHQLQAKLEAVEAHIVLKQIQICFHRVVRGLRLGAEEEVVVDRALFPTGYLAPSLSCDHRFLAARYGRMIRPQALGPAFSYH